MRIKNINNKGITLIALIVTIIVLIILAAVSINLVIGERGIITTASSTKEKQKAAEILEELELKKADIVIDTKEKDVSIDEYVEAVVSDGNMKHKVYSDGVEKIDNKKAYITVDDEYIFLLEQLDDGNLKITYEGKANNLKPRIQDVQIKSATNSIEVKVTAMRAEKYVFYIKEKDAQNYNEGIEKNVGEHKFESLGQNKEYSIKIEAVNENGKDETELNRTTGQMANLTQAEVKYVKTETNWTNKNVTTTIELNTEKDVTGYKIQYTKFAEGEDVTSEKIQNASWLDYQESGIVSEQNETIYTRLYDGNNATSYTSTEIKNIDKKDPVISTELASSDVTTKGFKLNVGITDANSGFGKIVWHYKLSSDADYTTIQEIDTQLNGLTTGTTTQVTKTKTLDSLKNGKYSAYAVVYDVAGNSVETPEEEIELEKLATASGATMEPSEWTNGSVVITLPQETGYTTEYQIGTLNEEGTWTPYDSNNKPTVSTNTAVYYRYNDGKNASTYASKDVNNIDKLDPKDFTPTVSTVTVNSISVTASTEDQAATGTYGSSGIAGYRFKESVSNTWTNYQTSGSYTFSSLAQNTNYTITVEAKDAAGNTTTGTVSATTPKQLVTGITLNKTSTTINKGGTETLTATVTPTTAYDRSVTWSSSNTAVATVSSSGVVTGVADGTATITATSNDGTNKTASCTVTVKTVILANVAKPGDYVRYINKSNGPVLCRVLYNDSTYGLQVVTNYSQGDVSIGGTNESSLLSSFNNSLPAQVGQSIAYSFLNSSYADSGRCIGSNPSTGSIGQNNNDYMLDVNAMENAGIINIGTDYWLGANMKEACNVLNGYIYRYRYVTSSGSDSYSTFNYESSTAGAYYFRYNGTYTKGTRYVVKLKSGILTSGGNGTSGSPYLLVAQ